jgi:hypothetical protein
VHIDLDFMDTGGYVIIPIESAAVPIDAAAKKGEPRPVKKLKITQILDERQADKGKLLLEVKATGLGLVPELEEIVDINPDDFRIAKKSDQGVSVAKFDEDSPEAAVVSERTWMLTLEAKPDRVARTFHFGKAQQDVQEMTYQRYLDADLVTAKETVDLEASYGQASNAWMWWAGSGVTAVLLIVGVVLFLALRKPAARTEAGWQPPKHLSPFTVIGFLNRIQQADGLSEIDKGELKEAIGRLERHYFAGEENGPIDLRSIAENWAKKAR